MLRLTYLVLFLAPFSSQPRFECVPLLHSPASVYKLCGVKQDLTRLEWIARIYLRSALELEAVASHLRCCNVAQLSFV
jgi:hypothetical protein